MLVVYSFHSVIVIYKCNIKYKPKTKIMKTRSLSVLFIAVLCIATSGYAAKHRVNNTGGGAPFSTINSAIEAAEAGDTIYVEGSAIAYAGFTLNKPLTLIGPGYFLIDNPMTQANPNPATVGVTSFAPGAEGSLIMGMYFYHSAYDGGHLISFTTGDIVLKRNRLQRNAWSSYHGYTNHTINIADNLSNISILQNYIERTADGNGTAISIGNNCFALNISNNYVYCQSGNTFSMSSTAIANVFYNVINGGMTLQNSNVHNNIMIAGGVGATNCIVTNNIGHSTQFPLPNNKQMVDMNTVFDLENTSRDAKYTLLDNPSNPAIAYGVVGDDCGMFGGTTPYRLSGIPPVPAIYFFFGSPTGSNTGGLPVHVKIKSNN